MNIGQLLGGFHFQIEQLF